MLIDFTVENYRSIKEPVTLSAVAVKRSGRKSSGKRRPWVIPDDEIASPFVVEGRGMELLPVLGIFGANASGKTNVLGALHSFIHFMANGSFDYSSDVGARPSAFALDLKSVLDPSGFEVRVCVDAHIYRYNASVSAGRVVTEALHYIPRDGRSSRERLLFSRQWDRGITDWTNGKDFGNVYLAIQKSMRENEPFIAELTRRLTVDCVNPLTRWLASRWSSIGFGFAHDQYDDRYVKVWLSLADGAKLKQAARIVRAFDTGLTDIEIRLLDDKNGREQYAVVGVHEGNGVTLRLPFDEESHGTQRLFFLATKLVHAFDFATLVTIDELGANIHPNITHEIVRLFQDPEANPKRAQLIFTSHDNTLLTDNLLRRDQVWFTEKREDGSTHLYSLADFKARNDLAIDKAYLSGRFGAVPFLPTHEFMLTDLEAA